MKLIFLILLFSSTALVVGQEPPSANPPRFDVGAIDAGFYINNCLGFSYPIPDGWEINNEILGTSPGAAKHDGGGLILLIVDQHTKRPFFNRMVLSATDSAGLKFDTAEFVSRFVHAQSKDDQPGRKILKEAYAVDLAGKQFFRSDFSDEHSGATLYKAFLGTKFRGYFLGWTIVTGSPDELDAAANSLQKIVFRQDRPDPECVMGKEETQPGVIGGIITAVPSMPRVATPEKVRVSQGVAQRLLIRKVEPVYPAAARSDGIQGQVVLQAVVSTEGDVQDLRLVSGDPALASAAIDAVKQWKYKPYVLNGKAVKVETQITVIFTLQRP